MRGVEQRKFLSLAEFARVSAFIDAGLPRDEVLEEAGILPDDWDYSQTTWLDRIGGQVRQQKYTLHARYAELFEKARKAANQVLRNKRRKLKGVMPVAPTARMSPILVSAQLVRPQASRGGGSAQPAAKPAALPATPRLTVEQLATLRAELVLAPDKAEEIRDRFGLNERSHEQEDAIWKERFGADKDLFQRYVKLFQYYRGLLAPRS